MIPKLPKSDLERLLEEEPHRSLIWLGTDTWADLVRLEPPSAQITRASLILKPLRRSDDIIREQFVARRRLRAWPSLTNGGASRSRLWRTCCGNEARARRLTRPGSRMQQDREKGPCSDAET